MSARILLILIVGSITISCSDIPSVPPEEKLSNEPSADLLPNSGNENKKEKLVKAVGTFSNRRSDGVHEWGYEVELWNYEGNLIGIFVGLPGTRLIGDPPIGLLEDVAYNFDTNNISFRVFEPDVEYVFEGVLEEERLYGKLFDMGEQSLTQRCATAQKINLIKLKKPTAEMQDFSTLDAWSEKMRALLKVRNGDTGSVK